MVELKALWLDKGEYFIDKVLLVSFTVDLACSSKRCLSHSAELR